MKKIAVFLLLLFLFPAAIAESPKDHFSAQDRSLLSNIPDDRTIEVIVLGHVSSPYAVKYFEKLDMTVLKGPKIALLAEISGLSYRASLSKNYTYQSLVANLGEGIPMSMAPYGRTEGVNGSDITVAVLDTGVDASHPSLEGIVVGRYDARGELASPGDPQGHGTLVSSVIAGKPIAGEVNMTTTGLAPEPNYGYPFNLYIPQDTTVNVTLVRSNDDSGYDMVLVLKFPDGNRIIVDDSTNSTHRESRVGSVQQGTLYIIAATAPSSTGYQFPRALFVRFHSDVPIGGGIAQGAKIYGVKVFSAGDESTDTAHILDGINHVLEVADTYNIRVANLSLGSEYQDEALDAAMHTLAQSGILPVVAAGNSGPGYNTIGSPGIAPDALTVGAATMYGTVAEYSSRGSPMETEISKIKPDVLGVGGGIYVGPRIEGADTNGGDGPYAELVPNDLTAAIGTSFASPTVAGIAALVYSAFESIGLEASPMLVKYIICSGTYETINLDNQESDSNLPSLDRIGKDAVEGRGMTYLPAIMQAVLHRNDYAYGSMPNMTLSFGPKLGEPKVYAFAINTTIGSQVIFSLLGSAMLDVDILVYSLEPTEIEANLGNPVLVMSSTSTSSRESVKFIANSTRYLLIIRRVSGEGNVTLFYSEIEDNKPPEIGEVKAVMLYKYLSLSAEITDNYGVTRAILKDQNGKTYYLKPKSETERYFSGFIDTPKLEGRIYATDIGGNTVSKEVKANGRIGVAILVAITLLIFALAIILIKASS